MPPKTLFVAGARRGVGKTLLSAFLLRSLPGTGAIKVTCCRVSGGCPRNRPCGVCRALAAPYAVIRDHDILAQPGKDTARLLAAASGGVVWLQSREEALAEGLAAALSVFAGAPAVVVEGNAAFQVRAPDLGVLVLGPGVPKPSVNVALPRVDCVVLNAPPAAPGSPAGRVAGSPVPALPEGLREGVRFFSFDVARSDASADARAFVEWVAGKLALPARSG